jgi:hypothetical protein
MMFGPKIKINKDLLKKAEQFAKAAGYSTVDEFVCHLVEKEVTKIDEGDSEEEVKKKLQGLGYLS